MALTISKPKWVLELEIELMSQTTNHDPEKIT